MKASMSRALYASRTRRRSSTFWLDIYPHRRSTFADIGQAWHIRAHAGRGWPMRTGPFRSAFRSCGSRARSLRSEAEVGERALAVEVGHHARHLAGPDVQDRGSSPAVLPEFQAACPAAPTAGVQEHQNPLVVE